MPLDPHAKRLLDMLALARPADPAQMAIEERRESFRKLMALSRGGADVASVEDRTIPGPGGPLTVRFYRPEGEGDGPLPVVIFFHGGGLVAGDLDTHDALCRILCHGIGAIVAAADYRLAPEHPFPAAIEDSIAATAWIAENAAGLGIDPERIVVAGDSGGGTLATIVCQKAREAGPRIALQLLLCPVLDLGAETASRQEFATGYLLDRALMARDLEHYGPVDPRDPLVSPLRADDLAGMPRTLIHSAAFDPLRDEDAAYARRLEEAGVAVSHTCHAGMPHHFYGLTGIVPAARESLDAICREARAVLAR
ncbi:MAG: alpha/beta hydrolase [Bauldia sp.]|nr:alpha/beta hydrolase [Bauldia sp.]